MTSSFSAFTSTKLRSRKPAVVKFKKRLNTLRRAFMKVLTRRFSRTVPHLDQADYDIDTVKRVLICRPNHRLGNLLLITPLLQEIAGVFPKAKIDVFIKGGIGPVLFKNYSSVDRIIALPRKAFKQPFRYIGAWLALRRRKYDLVVNVVNHSSSGRISANVANARFRFMGDFPDEFPMQSDEYMHMGKFPVFSFRTHVRALGLSVPRNTVPMLDLKLNEKETALGRQLLFGITGSFENVICLYTFATGEKMYTPEWWKQLYTRLRLYYPGFAIMELLPVENVSQLAFTIPSFYSRDLRQIGAVLANAAVFIGADSGMMHLASASKVPTIGLFKTTKVNVYAPYNPGSVAIDTRENGVEECVRAVDRVLNAR